MSIEVIVAIISSGSIGAFVTFLLSLKKDKRDDYTTIISTYRDEFSRQATKINELEGLCKQYSALIQSNTAQINALKLSLEKFTLLEPAQHSLPLPFWIKDNDGTMLHFNDAFVEIVLKPNKIKPEDYLGKTDIQMWGEEHGKVYYETDIKAKREGILAVTENLYINGDVHPMLVIKYAIKLGSVVIGVAGLAINKQIIKDK
jgi:hypothetical protein